MFGHFFSRLSFLASFSPLWETARYRLKYFLKGPLSPKQPTNQLQGCGRVVRWCWVNFTAGASYNLDTVGQGPTALAVGAGGVIWTFLLSSILSLLFLPLFGRRLDID